MRAGRPATSAPTRPAVSTTRATWSCTCPRTHQASIIARQRAGWLRCRLIEAQPDQPTYSASPTVVSVEAMTIGGTVPTVHAEVVREEVIGRSDGTPGQRFALQRHPVVASEAAADADGAGRRRRGGLAGGAGRALRPVRAPTTGTSGSTPYAGRGAVRPGGPLARRRA